MSNLDLPPEASLETIKAWRASSERADLMLAVVDNAKFNNSFCADLIRRGMHGPLARATASMVEEIWRLRQGQNP